MLVRQVHVPVPQRFRPRVPAREPASVLAQHRHHRELDLHRVVGVARKRDAGGGGSGLAEVLGAGERRGLEVRDAHVACVPAVELHHVVTVGPELREHAADLRRHLPGLGHDVAGVQHGPLRVDRRLRGHEDHPAAAHSLAERRGQGRCRARVGERAGCALAVLAAHRVAFDLDLQAFVGEVRHRHRGDGRARAGRKAFAHRGEKPRLVDAAVVHVEAEQGDEIRQVAVELFEHPGEVGHRAFRLGGEVARVAHRPVRGQVHLAADPHHLPAAHSVLVVHVDGPVPVAIRPRMTLVHDRCSVSAHRLPRSHYRAAAADGKCFFSPMPGTSLRCMVRELREGPERAMSSEPVCGLGPCASPFPPLPERAPWSGEGGHRETRTHGHNSSTTKA